MGVEREKPRPAPESVGGGRGASRCRRLILVPARVHSKRLQPKRPGPAGGMFGVRKGAKGNHARVACCLEAAMSRGQIHRPGKYGWKPRATTMESGRAIVPGVLLWGALLIGSTAAPAGSIPSHPGRPELETRWAQLEPAVAGFELGRSRSNWRMPDSRRGRSNHSLGELISNRTRSGISHRTVSRISCCSEKSGASSSTTIRGSPRGTWPGVGTTS